jgi:hypothetical protein
MTYFRVTTRPRDELTARRFAYAAFAALEGRERIEVDSAVLVRVAGACISALMILSVTWAVSGNLHLSFSQW